MDIFEQLKESAGCEYISDLRFSPFKERALKQLPFLPIEELTVFQLNDLASYFYNSTSRFEDKNAALAFFKEKRVGAGA
ncbi:MAG: hypothetical protein ACI4F7_00030 [Acutalibacteraceae bacterium]